MSNYIVSDTDLTSIADAIRTKTGGSSSIAFPAGFVSEIGNIPSGGGGDLDDFIENHGTISSFEGNMSIVGKGAFGYCDSIATVNFPNCLSINDCAFTECHNLITVSFPKCTTIGNSAFYFCYNIQTVSFPSCTTILSNAFAYCSNISTADFPNCTSIKNYAFNHCDKLVTASFPNCTMTGSYAFANCLSLTTIDFPKCTIVEKFAFNYCEKLTTASFPSCEIIGSSAFQYCYNLLSLYLLNSSVAALKAVNAFSSTPISNYTTSTGGVYGSIYVPASLYSDYIAANNWSTYAARFVSM